MMDERRICAKAIRVFGTDAQLDTAVEEMAEFIKARNKLSRAEKIGDPHLIAIRIADMVTEVADVRNTLMQVEMILLKHYKVKPSVMKRARDKQMAKLASYLMK
jgi:alkylation response protein AidB-like acyl-CoA dehydrogenase